MPPPMNELLNARRQISQKLIAFLLSVSTSSSLSAGSFALSGFAFGGKDDSSSVWPFLQIHANNFVPARYFRDTKYCYALDNIPAMLNLLGVLRPFSFQKALS